MAGEGNLLRKAREEKGWTYHDVEESIKIRARYLEALEEEEYNILPGSTYTKGFLRTYSKHLGINLYKCSLDLEPSPEIHPPLTTIQSTPVWFKPIVLIVMALLAAAIVLGITYFSKTNHNPQVSDYKPAPLPTAPETQNPADSGPNVSPPPAENTPQPPAEAPVEYKGVVAELIFKEDCWLKVRVDGVIVQDGMSNAGTTKILQGTKRIEFLIIGNAGGVTMKLNGKEVPPLGASREVVRNYVVTEDTIKSLPQ